MNRRRFLGVVGIGISQGLALPKLKAALRLGINRNTLHKKVSDYHKQDRDSSDAAVERRGE